MLTNVSRATDLKLNLLFWTFLYLLHIHTTCITSRPVTASNHRTSNRQQLWIAHSLRSDRTCEVSVGCRAAESAHHKLNVTSRTLEWLSVERSFCSQTPPRCTCTVEDGLSVFYAQTQTLDKRIIKTKHYNKPHMGLPVDFSQEAKFICQRWNTIP